jgi:hypothetical protein
MNINLIYDSSTSNAPAGFAAAMNYVVTFFDTVFTNPVTINIAVGWGEIAGQPLSSGALGESETAASSGYTYSQMKNALTANTAQSATDLTALANLPASDPTGGGLFFIGSADAKALGLISDSSMGIDGWIGFDNAPNTFTFDPNNRAVPGLYDFIGVAFHEISEVMGRFAGLNMFGGYSVLDLFRYSAPGIFSEVGRKAAYFSIDGGKTDLDNFNTNSSGDFGDWAATAGNDAFLAFSHAGVQNNFTAADITLMDAIGWNTVAPGNTTTISVITIQNDHLAITRTALALDQAIMIVSAIDAGTQSETQYVNSLLAQVANTTIPAVAVEASMYGAVGTSAEVTLLATQFLPGQAMYASQHGYDVQVFVSESLGLTFAFGDENGGTAFANKLGPLNPSMPNTAAGDSAAATAIANSVFGSSVTPNLINFTANQLAFFKDFYTHNNFGIANPTAAQIDQAARAVALGTDVGVALENQVGPLYGQVVNFLDDAAQGTAIYSASLSSQPNHLPFQASTAASVQLVGVGGHLTI